MRGPQQARTQRARSLRKAENEAERALWSELKGRRLGGAKFTRQFPIGRYFADFACRERQLVVELDGSQHAGSAYDRKRDQFMIEEGWSVLRFWNIDALIERDAVVDTILAALDQRLDPVDAPGVCFVAARGYREQLSTACAAPHPYPLPVENGERGAPASIAPSPRLRGEGEGQR